MINNMNCNRNYNNPTINYDFVTNRGITWFYTDQGKIVDCGVTNDQGYCDGNTANYGGGHFTWKCASESSSNLSLSDGICVKDTWNSNNILPCCLGTLNDAGSCDPTWCSGTSTCQATVQQYCSDPTKIASDPVCLSLCSRPENKSWCDFPMHQYCQTHTGTDICSCIESLTPRPGCFDANCSTNGYLTSQNETELANCGQACFEIVDCIKANTCTVTNNTFEEHCSGTPYPSPNPPPIINSTYVIYLIIALIFIIFLIVIYGIYKS